jgi:hypothetical protein
MKHQNSPDPLWLEKKRNAFDLRMKKERMEKEIQREFDQRRVTEYDYLSDWLDENYDE